MAYTLGAITLPTPVRMEKIPIETSVSHITLDGTTKKDIGGRKYRYLLYYRNLTQAEVTSILSEYNLEAVRDFAVSDGSLTIASTSVHIELGKREHNVGGSDYREDLVLSLEEVT